MVNNRTTLIFYPAAICNLKCKYCYIDKNPALLEIDRLLEESFKDIDYYYNFTKAIFPNPEQLQEVQFWGGEPSIGLLRTVDIVNKLVWSYPNLKTFMMSSNFTLPDFTDIIINFCNSLPKIDNRIFTFRLQISLDGTEEITDNSRGLGVTKKVLENYFLLLERSKEIQDNVKLELHFKPTLDNESIALLQTREKVIEYYTFFDKLAQAARAHKNIKFYETTPNTASPSPHSQEDGIRFANLCKICRDLEKEGLEKYFKCYKTLMPFGTRGLKKVKLNNYVRYGNCGVGRSSIGLLPNYMISVCHNGFVDLVAKYKEECAKKEMEKVIDNSITILDSKFFASTNEHKRLTLTMDEFLKFEKQMEYFFDHNLTVKDTNIASLIQVIARTKQIDEKYAKLEEAERAAAFINQTFSYCIRDNVNSTGCIELPPLGQVRLLLNGAMEVYQND